MRTQFKPGRYSVVKLDDGVEIMVSLGPRTLLIFTRNEAGLPDVPLVKKLFGARLNHLLIGPTRFGRTVLEELTAGLERSRDFEEAVLFLGSAARDGVLAPDQTPPYQYILSAIFLLALAIVAGVVALRPGVWIGLRLGAAVLAILFIWEAFARVSRLVYRVRHGHDLQQSGV